MWMVCGLGNPGAKYMMTRHNIGFMAIDAYAASVGGPRFREERQALVAKIKIEETEVLLVKPQTFMNNSGEPVLALCQFYKIAPAELVVLHDEIDQPFGAIKIHRNRGHGGHNGIRSLSEKLGTSDYSRIRLGVGRPSNPQMAVADYVLQNFAPNDVAALPDFLQAAGDAFETLVLEGYDKAATRHTRAGILGANEPETSE
jgi:PTH1 family peptidyl-tRNA hydrolase